MRDYNQIACEAFASGLQLSCFCGWCKLSPLYWRPVSQCVCVFVAQFWYRYTRLTSLTGRARIKDSLEQSMLVVVIIIIELERNCISSAG